MTYLNFKDRKLYYMFNLYLYILCLQVQYVSSLCTCFEQIYDYI